MEPLPAAGKIGVVGWCVAMIFLGGIAGLVIYSPEWRLAVCVLAPIVTVVGIVSHIHAKRLERERSGDSICTFARSLPVREHDTWIVRAVYEGLSNDRGHGIRPEDRLEEDLLFLPEDIEDLATDIATRARRSMTQADQNPLANRVVTVLDLIKFLEHQPKIGRAYQVVRGNRR